VAWPTEAFSLSGLGWPSPHGLFSPRLRAGEHSPHRHRWQWPANSGGDRRQGGPGRGARATRCRGEMAGSTSERRARPEGNNGGGWQLMVQERGRGMGGHWGCVDRAGGQSVKLDGGCGGSRRLLVEEAAEAWPA
jgi:hypothetical protein